MEIKFLGKYGELFSYEETGNDYIVSCKEIGWNSKHISKEEFQKVYETYTKTGVQKFDKANLENLKMRAENLGEYIRRKYNVFFNKDLNEWHDEHALYVIQKIVKDSLVLELNEEQYIEWCIKYTDDIQYKQMMLKIKKEMEV